MLMPQGLCTYHSHYLVQSSLLGPQNFLPLGICSLVVCSSVTFSVRPYMNSLFKMAISTHLSTIYYPPLLIHIWYTVYFTYLFCHPNQNTYFMRAGVFFICSICWFIPNAQNSGWHVIVIQQIFSECKNGWMNDQQINIIYCKTRL